MTPSFTLVFLILFLGFLGLLVAIAVTAAMATRGPRDGRRGFLGGCGLITVLAVLSLLAVGGFLALLATLGTVALVRHNPVRSVEVSYEERPTPAPPWDAERQPPAMVCLTFELDGSPEVLPEILSELCEVELDDIRVRLRAGEGEQGDLFDVFLPLTPEAVEELQRDLEHLPPLLERLGDRVPTGVKLRLRSHAWPR
jgi:hypothetical protein